MRRYSFASAIVAVTLAQVGVLERLLVFPPLVLLFVPIAVILPLLEWVPPSPPWHSRPSSATIFSSSPFANYVLQRRLYAFALFSCWRRVHLFRRPSMNEESAAEVSATATPAPTVKRSVRD